MIVVLGTIFLLLTLNEGRSGLYCARKTPCTPKDTILTPGFGYSITPVPKFPDRPGRKTAFIFPMLKYGPTPGFPEFRESIAAYVSETRRVKVGAENVCVVPGGKPIMFFSMLALLEPGDEVIYPDPSFPIYESMIRFIGATPVAIPPAPQLTEIGTIGSGS
jgi:histidinol-phosphate/aromatic aminotransferase/cobyric acid decarboxylase-like protein